MNFALNKPLSKFLPVFGAAIILILDQYIKHEVRQEGGFYVCNQGISFGLRINNVFFWLVLGIVLLFGLFWLFYKKGSWEGLLLFSLGMSLISGGALSNILDRFVFGCVFDYIKTFPWFPLFNLADFSISLGSLLVVFHITSDKHS
jgi:lipoprotein signal peptidase